MTFQITIKQDQEGSRAIHGCIFNIEEVTGETVETFAMPEFPLAGMSAAEREGAWESFIRTAVSELYWRIIDTRKKKPLEAETVVPSISEQIKNIWKDAGEEKA